MHVNPNNKVLATTTFDGGQDPRIHGYTMPVAWKKVYGKGNASSMLLGQTTDVFDIPEAITIVKRGMLWASQKPATHARYLVSPVYPRR